MQLLRSSVNPTLKDVIYIQSLRSYNISLYTLLSAVCDHETELAADEKNIRNETLFPHWK